MRVEIGEVRAEMKLMGTPDTTAGTRTGGSGTFTNKHGERFAVSSATHYAWRSRELSGLNALEFFMAVRVQRMDAQDTVWCAQIKLNEDTAGGDSDVECVALPSGRGRPRKHYVLRSGHPLCESHILVRRAKWGVPAFAGEPPPSAPRSVGLSSVARMRQRDFARYFTACFVPWPAADLPTTIRRSKWIAHVAELGEQAGFNSKPLDRGDAAKAKSRVIAAGRISRLVNVTTAFRVELQTAIMLTKHRARARVRWNGDKRPGVSSVGGVDDAARQAVKDINKLNAKAARLRGSKDAA